MASWASSDGTRGGHVDQPLRIGIGIGRREDPVGGDLLRGGQALRRALPERRSQLGDGLVGVLSRDRDQPDAFRLGRIETVAGEVVPRRRPGRSGGAAP